MKGYLFPASRRDHQGRRLKLPLIYFASFLFHKEIDLQVENGRMKVIRKALINTRVNATVR